MKAFEIYALINEGEIKNVIPYLIGTGAYTLANIEAVRQFGPQAFAVDCSYYRVGIGSKYHDGKFFNIISGVETEVPKQETEEEAISRLSSSQEDTDVIALDHEERIILLEVGE